jgi:hypothetical protein
MSDSIKLIRFDGEWIVSDIEEIEDTTFGDPDCVLKYPYQVEGKCLAPWPAYSDQREIVVRSSEITVLTDPNTFILSSYINVVAEETE